VGLGWGHGSSGRALRSNFGTTKKQKKRNNNKEKEGGVDVLVKKNCGNWAFSNIVVKRERGVL
jgi:hypothetical protein